MPRVAVVSVFLFGALLVGCGSSGPDVTVEIQAKDIAFIPTTATVKEGEKVEFVLRNGDTVEHNITVPDLSIDEDAEGGETTKATATPDAGSYEFHCKYHPDQMKGTITVT